MALFKVNRGNSTTLPSTMIDGYAYFCTDTGEFFIDYADSNGTLHRKQINAKEAEKITGYDIRTILNSSDIEIPTSKAVLDALSVKADIANLPIIKDSSAGTINLTWDGEIGDKDNFTFGTWTYCKQSSMAPEYSSVTSGYTFRSNGMQNTNIVEGVNCYAVGDAIVVTTAGICSKGGTQFEAPSTGIYFGRMSSWYTDEIEMDCDISYTSLFTTDVNGAQHIIAVDEKNLLSVTDMSNGSVAYMATTSYVDDKLSESVNPDWEESDSSSKSYIENRPFYTDKATLLQENSLAVVKEKYYNYYSYEYEGDAVPFIPVEGAIYTVIFNGTTYTCSVKMNGANPYIGNDVKNDVFVSGQEPFQMYYSNYWKSLKVNTTTLGPHSITVIGNEIRKLDEKYLPDNLARTDIAQTISAENTFTVSPVVPDPTSDTHVTNKSYVDNQIDTSVSEAIDSKLMIVEITPYADGSVEMSHTFDEIYDAAIYNKIIMLRYAGDWTHYFLTEYSTSAVYFSAVMTFELHSGTPIMSYVIIDSSGNITKDQYATIRFSQDIGVLPGQIIKVKSLQNGLPSDWEAADIPSLDDVESSIDSLQSGLNTHSDNTTKHITATERSTWNAKSNFSGDYNDLTNKPTIPSIAGLATETYVGSSVSTHNTSTSSHNDIRDLITGLTTRLNTLANSDDTTLDQMSEVVAYIKNNKNLIDGITTSKINVDDIIDNLTTNVTNKPLSAAQGVALKALIDSLEKADVGLSNVDNTSDANKPVSTAQATAIADAKKAGTDAQARADAAYDLASAKVDKVTGKGLSTNDYTTDEKNKLAGIAAGAEANVNADWNATSGDAQILNKPTLGSLASKSTVAKTDLASDVQTSLGKADTALQSYTETDPTVPAWAKAASKPTYTAAEVGALPNTTVIPDALADLNDDANHRTVTDTEKVTWNAKSNFSGNYNDLTNKPTIPAAVTVDSALSSTSTNPVQNKVINTELSGKAPTSHASTATTYGTATSSNYGHVKLSDSTSSTSGTSGGIAATPAAVKAAYDLANSKSSFSGSYNDLTNKPTIPRAYTHPSTHAASMIAAGTFSATGVCAKTGTDYTTARVRNIKASTTDLTAGSSSLSSGDIYIVYE